MEYTSKLPVTNERKNVLFVILYMAQTADCLYIGLSLLLTARDLVRDRIKDFLRIQYSASLILL